ATIEIKIRDFLIVPREIDDQALADCSARQACARTARRDRNIFRRSRADDGACLFRRLWECYPEGFDLINGSVGGIQMASQVVEANVAIDGANSRFLCCGHRTANLTQLWQQ